MMERNFIRGSLGTRLDVEDLKYDIKRLMAERDYHKSKLEIFEQTIRAQQAEIDEVEGNKRIETKGEMYK